MALSAWNNEAEKQETRKLYAEATAAKWRREGRSSLTWTPGLEAAVWIGQFYSN